MKSAVDHFVSCDWGSTNLRIALVDTHDLRVLKSFESTKGVKAVFEKFQEQDEHSQFEFFKKVLLEELSNFNPDCPVVISGMAFSSIGMFELNYAHMPLKMDGSNLVHKSFLLDKNRKAIAISGMQSDVGVMRGEEVQAIGLAEMKDMNDTGILILPGTHSKHLRFKNQSFYDLNTFMTGEIFQLLTEHSILSNSVKKSDDTNIYEDSFLEGLSLGFQGEMSRNLFSVRFNDLMRAKSKEANYLLLSGMIIGDELSYLQSIDDPIYLAAPLKLVVLYHIALRQLRHDDRLEILNESSLKKATFIGQMKVLNSFE